MIRLWSAVVSVNSPIRHYVNFRPIEVYLDFQQNYGLVADGICGAETLQALSRMSSQTGSGPGIISVRESEQLHRATRVGNSLKMVVGCFGDLQRVSRVLTSKLRERYDDVMTVEESDSSRAFNPHFVSLSVPYVQRSPPGLPLKSPSE